MYDWIVGSQGGVDRMRLYSQTEASEAGTGSTQGPDSPRHWSRALSGFGGT